MIKFNLNEWLSVVANIGILIGLVFVAIEVQQSNQNMELSNRIAIGTAEMDLVALSSEINGTIFENDQLPELYAKLSTRDPELTESQYQLAYYVAFKHINRYNAAQRAYDNGLISDRTYELYLQDADYQISRLPGLAPLLIEHYRGFETVYTNPSPMAVHILGVLNEMGYSFD